MKIILYLKSIASLVKECILLTIKKIKHFTVQLIFFAEIDEKTKC